MRLSVSQQKLAKAVSTVARAVSSRTTMPVLGNILLEAKGTQLRLAATNREMGIRCWIQADIDEDGAITIPARLLSEFIGSLPNEQVSMVLDERIQSLHLGCARFSANIKGLDAFEFPLIPTYQPNQPTDVPTVVGGAYTVEAGGLSDLINKVIFAASQDENRPALTGIEVSFKDGALKMAATDGYRLSIHAIATDASDSVSVIVPAKCLAEVSRMIKGHDADVTVVISEKRNQILFRLFNDDLLQHVELVSESIDAKYPDYMATVPKNWTTRCTVDAAAMQKALKVALLFARDSANTVRLHVVPQDNKLNLSASSVETGDNASDLDAGVEGDGIEIAINAKYLMDVLAQVDAPQVILETTQPTRPMSLHIPGNDEFLHVIMPMYPPR